jgi:hypothetical protein
MKTSILAIIAGTTFAATANAESAATYNSPMVFGSVGIDVTENAAGDMIGTPDIDLGIVAPFGIASIDLTTKDDDVVLDGYSLGGNVSGVAVSFGDQGDLLDTFGGVTEVVGGTTLANPADAHETLRFGLGGISAGVGLTDIGQDLTDVENVQVTYATGLAGIALSTGVDYNLDAEDLTVLTTADFIIMEEYAAGATVTYADDFAYEVNVGVFGVTGFMNGDADDMTQNIGAGYYGDLAGGTVSYYAEAGYNLDNEAVTPAAGLSFNF